MATKSDFKDLELSDKNAKYIQGSMADWFGVDLTKQQIEYYGKRNRALWADMLEGEFDTCNREQLIDEIVSDVLGSGKRWPRGGDGNATYERFMNEWLDKARSAGIRVVS